jgi:hypothetical protein
MGEDDTINVDDLLPTEKPGPRVSIVISVADALRPLFEAGPCTTESQFLALADAGIAANDKALQRARTKLGVELLERKEFGGSPIFGYADDVDNPVDPDDVHNANLEALRALSEEDRLLVERTWTSVHTAQELAAAVLRSTGTIIEEPDVVRRIVSMGAIGYRSSRGPVVYIHPDSPRRASLEGHGFDALPVDALKTPTCPPLRSTARNEVRFAFVQALEGRTRVGAAKVFRHLHDRGHSPTPGLLTTLCLETDVTVEVMNGEPVYVVPQGLTSLPFRVQDPGTEPDLELLDKIVSNSLDGGPVSLSILAAEVASADIDVDQELIASSCLRQGAVRYAAPGDSELLFARIPECSCEELERTGHRVIPDDWEQVLHFDLEPGDRFEVGIAQVLMEQRGCDVTEEWIEATCSRLGYECRVDQSTRRQFYVVPLP